MPKYVRNKSNAIRILFNGSMRLAPAGKPGSVKPLSRFVEGHADLNGANLEIMTEKEYIAWLNERIHGKSEDDEAVEEAPETEGAEPVEEEPEEEIATELVVEEPEEEPEPEKEEPEEEEAEEEGDAPVDEEPGEEVEEDSTPAMSLEEFKEMDFSDKKDKIRMLGLEDEVSLRSNDSVDEGYEKYLNGDFE